MRRCVAVWWWSSSSSANDASTGPAIGADRTRTAAFNHVLVNGGGGRGAAEVVAIVLTELDKEDVFFPADWAIGSVPLTHRRGLDTAAQWCNMRRKGEAGVSSGSSK